MFIRDTAAATSHEVTPEGFLRLRARIARTGLHDYRAAELGHPPGFAPDEILKVYRPPDEVFDAASLASFRAKPVTDGHPPEMVDARNWRRYAIGQAGPDVTREADHLVTDLTIADADAAARALAGAELSNGYFADFVFEPGTTPEGEAYDAVQRNIRGNHIALVDQGRCGASCRVGDCGCAPVTEPSGGVAARDAGRAAPHADREAGTLDHRVAEQVAVIDAARRHFGPGFEPQGRDTDAIRRLVVGDVLGAERVRARSDAYVAAAFDALSALRTADNPLAAHLRRRTHPGGHAALAARNRYLADAWKGDTQGDA